jgi:hypothetical protein
MRDRGFQRLLSGFVDFTDSESPGFFRKTGLLFRQKP